SDVAWRVLRWSRGPRRALVDDRSQLVLGHPGVRRRQAAGLRLGEELVLGHRVEAGTGVGLGRGLGAPGPARALLPRRRTADGLLVGSVVEVAHGYGVFVISTMAVASMMTSAK